MSPSSELAPKRIDLKTAIAALRSELIGSFLASQNEPVRFEIGEIAMQFQLEIEQSTEAKGSLKFWVVEGSFGGAAKEKNTHTLTIPLKPLRKDGHKVLTGGNQAWE